jgi:thiamine-phosphate pyrophosphorylase
MQSHRSHVDLRCYAIVDPEVAGGHDLADLCRMLAAGGVTLVQLRDKLSDTRVMVERARAIKSALGPVPLVINDRVDVALAIGCEGVHIGWDDMAPADARRLLGPEAIIGLTINSPQRADATDLDLIDYAGIGGVYGTTSKVTKNSPIGIAGMARVIEALHRRKRGFLTCGIAGIHAGNAAPVIEAGADGVSVISALSLAKDPRAATADLLRVVDVALAKRTGQ